MGGLSDGAAVSESGRLWVRFQVLQVSSQRKMQVSGLWEKSHADRNLQPHKSPELEPRTFLLEEGSPSD